MAAGKWKGTSAVHDRANYWSTGLAAFFDVAGQNTAPLDWPHPILTREQLKAYDPDFFALIGETMAYDHHVDWRFSPKE